MKIKLKDYSLISNEWIYEEIERLVKKRDSSGIDEVVIFCDGKIAALEHIKQQLIPSEQLAEKCFEAGFTADSIFTEKALEKAKQSFLNSEIEIQ